MLILIAMYQVWPWRTYMFSEGIMKWFAWLSILDSYALFEVILKFIGSLFLVPIIYASIVFKWQGSFIVSSIATVYSLYFVGKWNSLNYNLTNASLLMFPAVIIGLVSIEIESRRKDRQFFLEKEKEHRLFTFKMFETREKERKRIAQELHDDNIQDLLLIAKKIHSLTKEEDTNLILQNLKDVEKDVLKAIDDLRRLSLDLRPSILDNLGLVSAIRWVCDRISQESDINIAIDTANFNNNLPDYIELSLFRIAQESLNNIIRHSKASNVVIKLKSNKDFVNLSIKDDGQGFECPEKLSNFIVDGKMGLVDIEERVNSLKGTFEIYSKINEGTLLSVSIPLNQSSLDNYLSN